MSVRDDLIAAKALIDTPEKWTRHGYECAGSYCILGALGKAIVGDPSAAVWTESDRFAAAKRAVAQVVPNSLSIQDFNDRRTTTHADIMALFDRAIAAESRP